MKKRSKRDFEKFAKRNVHKRKGKARALDEIRGALAESGVSYDGAHIGIRSDDGRRARVTSRRGRDEARVRGIFSGSRSGFGFVTPEEGYDGDIFIPEDRTGGAIHGDLVEIVYHVYTSRNGEEKTEGRVTKIIEYGLTTLVGVLGRERSYMRGKRRIPGRWILIPDDSHITVRPRVDDTLGAREGEKVVAKLKRAVGYGGEPEAQITALLGDAQSKEANYNAILIESGMPLDFTPEELEEARRAAQTPLSDEGRVRFDGRTVLTIDGAGAKDLDDAVSIRKLPGGWRLGVHIADVSSYVAEKTALDRAVMARGTSVYFTDKVVPMLPPELSNGACSLNAGEDKYTLSAIITLNEQGEITKTEIYPSIIRSRVRGVYSEVNAVFDGTADGTVREKYKPVLKALGRMRELYRVLARRAEARGYLELEIPEAEIVLDGEGAPIDIVRRERGEAERMIEQFMLTANEGVARLLSEKGIPCVYRIHENPPEDKLDDFLLFAHNLGFDTSVISRERTDARDFSRLLAAAEERGLHAPVSYSLLRSMSKAKYSEVRSSHFGLGLDYYCHFTSPIRRLADLATHRMIHRVLLEGKRSEAYTSYARRAARAATDAELRAIGAERRIEDLYKVIYMSDRVGEQMEGRVSSVTSFGMFVELENTCEGLVPMSEMPGMFVFDEKNLTLRSGGLVYRLGDEVRVRLEEADITRGKLRFSLIL